MSSDLEHKDGGRRPADAADNSSSLPVGKRAATERYGQGGPQVESRLPGKTSGTDHLIADDHAPIDIGERLANTLALARRQLALLETARSDRATATGHAWVMQGTLGSLQQLLADASDHVDQGLQLECAQVLARGQERIAQARSEHASDASPAATAERAFDGDEQALPHVGRIQASFGRHDISRVRAHVGGPAADANHQLGAQAFAFNGRVAFASQPDLHLAAHEAAHIVQQRAGVALKGETDQPGDEYEQHADLVADAVVRGESAEPLLDRMAGSGAASAPSRPAVQRKIDGDNKPESEFGLYLKIHQVDLHNAIRQQLAETAWPDPAADVPFAHGGERMFAATLADALAARLDDGERFRKFIYPGNILARFREQVVSRQAWSPLFGESLAQLVERHAIASLRERIGPRYRAVLASQAETPSADDLMGSHPIDPYVAKALTERGVVDNSQVAATEKAEGQQPAKVSVKWLGHTDPALWNFVQVTSASARVEDVAATLWGNQKKSTMAFAITKYGDLFRVAPAHARMVIKARYPHELIGSTDTDANAATQLVALAQSRIMSGDAAARQLERTSAEQSNGGQDRKDAAAKHDTPEVPQLEKLMAVELAIASQLGAMHVQVSPFGLAAPLLPAMQANLDRIALLKKADEATRARWAPVTQFQHTQLLSIEPFMAPLVHEYPALMLPDLVLPPEKRQRRDNVKAKLTKLVQAAGVSHLRDQSSALLAEVMREDKAESLDALDAAHADIHEATRQAVSSGAGSDRSTGEAEQMLTSTRRRAQLGLSQSPYDRQKALTTAGESALRNRMRAVEVALEQLRQAALEVFGEDNSFSKMFPGIKSVPDLILDVRDHLSDVDRTWTHGYSEALGVVQDDPNAPDDWADWKARAAGLTAAQTAFGKIAGDQDINKFIRETQKKIKDQAFLNALTMIAMALLITVVTGMGAAAIGEAVAGALVGEATELAVEAGAITARGVVHGVVASAVSAPLNSLVQYAMSGGHGSFGWITLENTLMELFTRGLLSRFRATQNALKTEAHELAQLPHLTPIEKDALKSVSYTGVELTGELVGGMASQWAANRLVQTFKQRGEEATEPFAATLLQQGAALAIGRFFGARVHEWTKHRAQLEKLPVGSSPEAKALFKAREQFYAEAKQLGESLSPDPAAGEALAKKDAALVHQERALFKNHEVHSETPHTTAESHGESSRGRHEKAAASAQEHAKSDAQRTGAIPQSETPKSRDVATIAKDHPALQQLGSLPPEVMFGTQQHNRAQHAVQLLPEHDYAEFTSIVSSTPDPVAKGFLYKAIAAGNSVSEVRWLAAEMAGKDRGWLIDHLTLGDPRGVGGGVKQQWSTSCNAAMTLSLRGNYDPVFALRLRNRNMKVGEAHESDPNALNMNQADLEKQMLESAYGGSHPGSPAKHQGVANARDTHGVGRYADDLLNAQSGVTGMTFRSVDGPAGADVVVILDRSLDAGMQVPLVIGDNMNEQAHYVLVQGKRGAAGTTEYNIHDPWTGDTIWVSANDIANGTIPGRYHKVGTVEVPSALGNHEVATTTSQPAFAARGSAPSGARTATSESAVVSRESFFASGEQHAQEIEARVSGDVKQVVADTTRLALDSEWQVEAGLQVADPLFGETASNAFKTAASAHQKGSTEAQTLAKLTKQSRAMQGQMLDLFRDTKLSDGQRRHQLHRVINEWQHSLTQNRALFGGEFSNAFRFAEARRAVDASIGAGFSNKLVLDSNGALHKGKKSLGTFRELVDRVVATNRAFIEVGEPRELIIAISETAAGTREVLVLSRTRSSAPVPPPTSPTPVEVQNHPDSAAVIVDIGSGESSFAVDMVQASDRNGGPIVQTEYGPSAFDGSRTRRDLTWERAMPARSVDSVAVFGDPLQTIDVLFGKHGVKLVFINNVNAHYNAEQYRGLARALCKAMANGGRVEMQWTYSPETVGGPKGKRGHVQGRHVDDEVENTGDLETALQSEAPKFGRTITVRMAAPIKDQAYSREPSRRRDGADPSKDNITSPVPEHRSIITFD